MRKRYSRSYTVLSFLTMFSYRELPFGNRFFVKFRYTLYKGGDKGRAFAIIYSLSIHQSLRLPFSLRPLRG